MYPKGPCVKIMVALLRDGEIFQRWPGGRSSVHLKNSALRGNNGTRVSSSSCLLFSSHEVGGFASSCACALMYHLTTTPTQQGQSSHRLEPPNCEPQSFFCHHKLITSGICSSNRKLANATVSVNNLRKHS
jgi:hypothetical protein